MKYLMLPEGKIDGKVIPVTVVFLDTAEIEKAGLTQDEAIIRVAKEHKGPAAINVFDHNAVTTTSDGLVVEGAIVRMGASDGGRVNKDFGILPMAEIPYSEERIQQEPHLLQWKKLFPGKKLFRGPDPAKKIIPVHNVTISGRAANNNSATEMMNIITMDEMLFPILGQLECINHGNVLVGYTGEFMSVGIGMTVAEQFGRVFPHPQFPAGATAHGSGAYAKTLKQWIPCIACDKKVIAQRTLRALECGCVPARELDSVGCTREWMLQAQHMTPAEVIEHADELIPGVNEAQKHRADDIIQEKELAV